MQVWCSIEVFHKPDAEAIWAMVSDGLITTDILS
jgi:hypothetical protein